MIHYKLVSEIKKQLWHNRSANEIAYEFDFSDPSNFNRFFKKHTGKQLRRSYPIWRDGKKLDDLLVTQCLFAGNADVLPLHVGAIANGHGLVIDHCVFFNCKNPVVFWKVDSGTSHHDAMRYCLVYGGYFSGVWTTQSTDGDDFEFHHNIIAHCNTVWIRENGSTRSYKARDCIFTDYSNLAGYGSGPLSGTSAASTDFLKMENVQTTGDIQIEMDQSKRNYLQLVEGSFGIGGGAFQKMTCGLAIASYFSASSTIDWASPKIVCK